MGFLVILPFGALAAWIIFSIFRWLRRGRYNAKWWRAFGILSVVGLVIGIWLAFFSHYTVAKISMEGFPIPVSITSHQPPPDGPLVKSHMPLAITLGGWITDVLSGIAICLAPIAVVAFARENRGKLGVEIPP